MREVNGAFEEVSAAGLEGRTGLITDGRHGGTTQSTLADSAGPALGRDSELAVSGGALRAAAAGTGQCLVLEGAPVIGETRLLHEATASSRSPTHVLAHTQEPPEALMSGRQLAPWCSAGVALTRAALPRP
jgi:hypothetical protein